MAEIRNENRTVELSITSYGSEGQGVGRADGLAVFVKGALMGERVRAQITKTAPRFAEARLIEVLEKSPSRIEPACQYFERCGGCDLMHMDHDHQLEFKRMKVENAFRRIGGFEKIEVPPPLPLRKPFATAIRRFSASLSRAQGSFQAHSAKRAIGSSKPRTAFCKTKTRSRRLRP